MGLLFGVNQGYNKHFRSRMLNYLSGYAVQASLFPSHGVANITFGLSEHWILGTATYVQDLLILSNSI